jgi:hypothetical protein
MGVEQEKRAEGRGEIKRGPGCTSALRSGGTHRVVGTKRETSRR